MITTFTYDKANRLQTANAGGVITTYTNDAAGNRLSQVTADSGVLESRFFTWDAPGRMATVEIGIGMVTLTYNADGQRVIKDSPSGYTGYLYDHKRLLQETDEAGEITNTYASGTSEEFGDLIGEDDGMVHQYDAQADTNALLDNTGQVEAQYKYTAFGQVSAVSVSGGPWSGEDWSSLPLELTSHMMAGGRKHYYLDMETALYLLGGGANGRYYDTATCRFLSEDPKRQEGGDNNLYAYVHNNPVNHLDPSGHDDNTDQDKKNQQQQQRSTPVNQKSNLAQGSSNPANSSSAGGKDQAQASGITSAAGTSPGRGTTSATGATPATGTTSAAGTAHSTGTTVSDKTTVNQQARSTRTPVSQELVPPGNSAHPGGNDPASQGGSGDQPRDYTQTESKDANGNTVYTRNYTNGTTATVSRGDGTGTSPDDELPPGTYTRRYDNGTTATIAIGPSNPPASTAPLTAANDPYGVKRVQQSVDAIRQQVASGHLDPDLAAAQINVIRARQDDMFQQIASVPGNAQAQSQVVQNFFNPPAEIRHDPIGDAISSIVQTAGNVLNVASDLAGKVTLPARILGGVGLSFLSGDWRDDPNDYVLKDQTGQLDPKSPFSVVTINGIDTDPAHAKENLQKTLDKIKFPNSAGVAIPNGTYGLFGGPIGKNLILGDLAQILGEEFGLIDLPELRAAATINQIAAADRRNAQARGSDDYGTPIHVFAHSQGTQVFLNATELMDAQTRSMIDYHGYGGEAQIGTNIGLGFVQNTRGPGDPVPGLGQVNYMKGTFEGFPTSLNVGWLLNNIHDGFKEHNYVTSYIPTIFPSDLHY